MRPYLVVLLLALGMLGVSCRTKPYWGNAVDHEEFCEFMMDIAAESQRRSDLAELQIKCFGERVVSFRYGARAGDNLHEDLELFLKQPWVQAGGVLGQSVALNFLPWIFGSRAIRMEMVTGRCVGVN